MASTNPPEPDANRPLLNQRSAMIFLLATLVGLGLKPADLPRREPLASGSHGWRGSNRRRSPVLRSDYRIDPHHPAGMSADAAKFDAGALSGAFRSGEHLLSGSRVLAHIPFDRCHPIEAFDSEPSRFGFYDSEPSRAG